MRGEGSRPRRLALCLAAATWLWTPAAASGPGADDAWQGFAVAPYLLGVTADAATVAFHLRQPLPAEVLVQTAGGARRFSSPRPARSHFVRVTGLPPGQVSTYEVICGGGQVRTPRGDSGFQIRTAARPGESFSFTVYGDTRPGDNQTQRQHQAVVQQMLQVQPAFSLVLGDLVDDGSQPALWERFFAVEARLRRGSAIFVVPGDNDHAGGRGLWQRYFPLPGAPPYRFGWGGVQFLGLSTWGTLGAQPLEQLDRRSPQLRWLRRELARPEVVGASFRVLFLHDPVYISRGRSAEVLRRVWAPALTRGGVDLVFASWHLYERSRHGGVTHIVTGGAGAELVWLPQNPRFPSQAEARRHHFCRVDVRAGAMRIRAVAADGTVLDSVTLLPRSATGPAERPPLPAGGERRASDQRADQFAALGPGQVLADGLLAGIGPGALLALVLLLRSRIPGPSARRWWVPGGAAALGLAALALAAPPALSGTTLGPLLGVLSDPHHRPLAALLLAGFGAAYCTPAALLLLAARWRRAPDLRALALAGAALLLIAMATLIIYNLGWP